MATSPFSVSWEPDDCGLLSCIHREGTPRRVHLIELFLDAEMEDAICGRFKLLDGVERDDELFAVKRTFAVRKFVGLDFVNGFPENFALTFRRNVANDTAELQRSSGRQYMEEHQGPISNWEEFEKYPWPDDRKMTTRRLDWLSENMPEGMCMAGMGYVANFAEHLNWLMGYETMCLALYDDRDLIRAIIEKLTERAKLVMQTYLKYDRLKFIFAADDMGFKSGTLIGPDDLREFILPGHKMLAKMAHEAGRPYVIHSCGKLDEIMPDLINDVEIDGKHSYEDTIVRVEEFKQRYGDRIAALGGIDMDFLCRADEEAIRQRVRETLDACMNGGGYCLGTGNSVANYVPLNNYLAMIDEGRNYTGWRKN